MNPEIRLLQESIFTPLNRQITALQKDEEAEEYFGYNFHSDELMVKFRKAKITPKKIGQFVTLWQRDKDGKTIPFLEGSPIDLFIILAKTVANTGFFIFPKQALVDHHILSSTTKAGKRGFRIYPPWDNPDSKQALKSQQWQCRYFVDLKYNNKNTILDLFKINHSLNKT